MASLLDLARNRLAALAQAMRPRAAATELPVPEIHAEPVVPPPIDYRAALTWCKTGKHRLEFVLGNDRHELSGAGLFILLGPGRRIPVSPWLALGDPTLAGNLPALRPERLAELQDGASPLAAAFVVDGGPPAAWEAVARAIGPPGSGPRSDADLLVAHDLLAPEKLAEAFEQARPDEAFESALYRLGSAPLNVWLEALVGKPRLPGAAGRPFDDRLGMRLLAAHAITQGQLKQALATQADEAAIRPLGQLLEAPPAAIARVAAAQKPVATPLAEADALGEVLIRWGCVSRSDWMTAQVAGPQAQLRLVEAHKLQAVHLTRAQAYRHNLQRLLAGRQVRLGTVLVEQGFDRATLGKALAWQVDQPLPLADLMLVHRLLSPPQAARALGQQADRYRQLAEAPLAPLAPRPAEIPLATPDIAARRPLLDRRTISFAVLAAVALAYAISYGARLHGADYGWFDVFFPVSEPTPPVYLGARQAVDQVSRSRSATGPVSVQPVSALAIPGQGPADLAAGAIGTMTASQLHPGLVESGSWPRGPVAGPAAQAIGAWPGPGTPPPGFVAGTWQSAAKPVADGLPGNGIGRLAASAPPPGPSAHPGGTISGSSPSGALPALAPGRIPGHGLVPALRPGGPIQSLGVARAVTNSAAGAVPSGLADQRRPLAASVRRSEAVFRSELGEAYFQQGDLAEAAAEFSGAADSDPSLALPHYYLGRIETLAGQRTQAAQQFSRYLALAPQGEFAPSARRFLAAVASTR